MKDAKEWVTLWAEHDGHISAFIRRVQADAIEAAIQCVPLCSGPDAPPGMCVSCDIRNDILALKPKE